MMYNPKVKTLKNQLLLQLDFDWAMLTLICFDINLLFYYISACILCSFFLLNVLSSLLLSPTGFFLFFSVFSFNHCAINSDQFPCLCYRKASPMDDAATTIFYCLNGVFRLSTFFHLFACLVGNCKNYFLWLFFHHKSFTN